MAITKLIADSITSGAIANTPSFFAYMSGNQSISNAATLVQFNTELYDTDGCYDTSTYKFTPTSAGKYLINFLIHDDSASGTSQNLWLYKNGSVHTYRYTGCSGSSKFTGSTQLTTVVDMNGSSDYVQAYYKQNNASTTIVAGSGQYDSLFTGVKIIT